MKKPSIQNIIFFLLFVCLAGLSGSAVYLAFSMGNIAGLTTISAYPTPALTPTPTQAIRPSTVKECTLAQQGFESGIVFPRWSDKAYGGNDKTWLREVPQLKEQTSACWVEMPVLLQQTSLTSTVVTTGPKTPSVASFTYGIQYAHSQGLHVFVSLLVTIPTGAEHWVGKVQLTSAALQQQWFANYWQVIKPYVTAAQQAGAEQLAIGTEEQWLEDNAPATFWNNLISQVHSIFSGSLTYDVNWTALNEKPLHWMSNPLLKFIGVSAYVQASSTSKRLDPQQMPALWASKVKSLLDRYSVELGKPILISEVGYRDTADAFFQPWQITSSAPVDPAEQQGACAAVLADVLSDPHILGSFFWSWDGAGQLNLKDSLAANSIQHYYMSLPA